MVGKLYSWTDWFGAQDIAVLINKAKQDGLFKVFYTEYSNGSYEEEVSNYVETVFIIKLYLSNGLNVFHRFIETEVKI